ncbi:MAG TPA: class I SAM-dependent methyltransferase [Thermoplasmata archaeon]|nr:class I SAM-dependent methyltransferase [Thermoplasmata archaeon]
MPTPRTPSGSGPRPRREFDAWEQWYRRRDYRRMPWYSPQPSPWLVEATRAGHFRPGGSILDVGCGTGTNVLWLAQQGFRPVGVDVSPTAIAIATRRAGRQRAKADFRVAGVDRLPFGGGSFDAALDSGCFHSIPLRFRAPYAKELARVLRPDARFLLTWIPREVRTSIGPPHRPSLEETAAVFEPRFVFSEVHGYASGTPDGWKVFRERLGRCTALLVRRRTRPLTPR